MEATAKHDFDATVDSGVTLKRGTIVKFQFSDDKWYKAEVEGKEGLVPRNYVQLKPQDCCHGGITRGKAEELLRKQGYGGASLLQESQSFPGDFTLSVNGEKELGPLSANTLSQLCLVLTGKRQILQVEALFDFKPQEEGELSFKRGEIIQVLEQSDANWWKGNCNGQIGLFPASYVTPVKK